MMKLESLFGVAFDANYPVAKGLKVKPIVLSIVVALPLFPKLQAKWQRNGIIKLSKPALILLVEIISRIIVRLPFSFGLSDSYEFNVTSFPIHIKSNFY